MLVGLPKKISEGVEKFIKSEIEEKTYLEINKVQIIDFKAIRVLTLGIKEYHVI